MVVEKIGEKYGCNICGNEVMVTKVGGGTLVCCSKEMEKMADILVINKSFVQEWSRNYDKKYQGSDNEKEERAIRDWLSKQKEPKYLNKEYFVKLGVWKSARVRRHYEANDNNQVVEITRTAYLAPDELLKLKLLMTLNGVGVPVASTILHYLQPDKFPIFDYHCRNALAEAGLWKRDKKDASDKAWLDYLKIMREVSTQLGVSLRELDKAMFAYDKHEQYLS